MLYIIPLLFLYNIIDKIIIYYSIWNGIIIVNLVQDASNKSEVKGDKKWPYECFPGWFLRETVGVDSINYTFFELGALRASIPALQIVSSMINIGLSKKTFLYSYRVFKKWEIQIYKQTFLYNYRVFKNGNYKHMNILNKDVNIWIAF